MPANLGFEGGETRNLFQIILFSSAEENHLSLKIKQSKLEAGPSSTLFPCENWVTCRKEYFLLTGFSMGRNTHFVQNMPIQVKWRSTCTLETKPSMLEVEHLAHCFPVRIELVFERNTSCPSEFSKLINSHFVPNRPIELNWRNSFISWNKSIYVRQ
jgi:hypothetical protein